MEEKKESIVPMIVMLITLAMGMVVLVGYLFLD